MATYPYISGQAGLTAALTQLRKGFPAKVDAGYLQRFNIAPANESYIISILRFLGFIDDEGNRVEDKTGYFYGNDDGFKSGLEDTLRIAYAKLFAEMGDDALDAERAGLTHWFRQADKTSDLVGQRQAATFHMLAAFAGHGDIPIARANTARKAVTKKVPAKTAATAPAAKVTAPVPHLGGAGTGDPNKQEVGLSVRIEVNLPSAGDAETYDSIFASIRKHLMS